MDRASRVQVHPGFCMPSNLPHFAKMAATVLRRWRYTGDIRPEAPAVLRRLDGPWEHILPCLALISASESGGEVVNLRL